MNRYRIILGIAVAILLAIACSEGGNKSANSDTTSGISDSRDSSNATPRSGKGIGNYTDVKLTHPLDQSLVANGRNAYEVKCMSCHKLTDEMLVGPGWKNVTVRRTPEWIMNFMTNTDEMLDKDAEAISMLEVCLVRMPNQNSSDEEARALLEFMRSNDSEEVAK